MNQIASSAAASPPWRSLPALGARSLELAHVKCRPAIRLFTRELPRPRQHEAWTEQISPLFELRTLGAPPQGFVGELEAWHLGEIVLVRTRAPLVAYGRSLRQCRSDGLDHWLVSAVSQAGPRHREMELRIWRLDAPLAGRAPAGDMVHMFMPRDFLRDTALPAGADRAIAASPLGRRLAGFLVDLAGHMSEFSRDDLPGLSASLRAMLLACLAPAAASGMQPALEVALLERARRLVQRNLYSPSLGVDELCHELGVSRSRLYRLFEPLGGVVHYIRARRLLDAHRALADARDTRAIVDIAAERGFGDPAEFSRAFKRAFGYRPRDARRSGAIRPLRAQRLDDMPEHTLAGLLRLLA
jgi:AraC-like DNA-binding protein